MYITKSGEVLFPGEDIPQCAAIFMNKLDFNVQFDHQKTVWTTSWKWASGQTPKRMKNSVPEYTVPDAVQDE